MKLLNQIKRSITDLNFANDYIYEPLKVSAMYLVKLYTSAMIFLLLIAQVSYLGLITKGFLTQSIAYDLAIKSEHISIVYLFALFAVTYIAMAVFGMILAASVLSYVFSRLLHKNFNVTDSIRVAIYSLTLPCILLFVHYFIGITISFVWFLAVASGIIYVIFNTTSFLSKETQSQVTSIRTSGQY